MLQIIDMTYDVTACLLSYFGKDKTTNDCQKNLFVKFGVSVCSPHNPPVYGNLFIFGLVLIFTSFNTHIYIKSRQQNPGKYTIDNGSSQFSSDALLSILRMRHRIWQTVFLEKLNGLVATEKCTRFDQIILL